MKLNGYHDPRTLYQTEALTAWQEGRYFPPVLVEISPSERCNQNCRYCYTQSRVEKNEIPGDLLIDIFRQLAIEGVKAVLIQGTGEPLYNKALPEAIVQGDEAGLTVCLTTNAVMLSPAIQERILQHLFYVRLSVLESDPVRYAYFHQCSISQWNILDHNLRHMVKLRNERQLKTALIGTVYLEEINFKFAYDIVKYYKDMGLDYIMVQEAIYGDYSPAGGRDYPSHQFKKESIARMKASVLSLNDDEFKVRVRFPLHDKDYDAGMDAETFTANFCQGIKFTAVISADCNVYSCWRGWGKPELSYGNLKDDLFGEIWRRRVMIEQEILTTPPEGSECKVCNIWKLNTILHDINHASGWKDILL